MQQQTVVNDSGFLKYSWAHVALFNTAAWRFLMQCHLRAQKSSTFNWAFLPRPTCTVMSLDSLNLFTMLCMVLGERPQFLAILHCEMWNVIFYLFFWWNLAQSDESWSSFACKDWNAPFMPKHDTLTCYQFTYLLWTVTKEFNMDNHFTFIFNFFVMCCSRQKKKCLYLQNTFTLVSENLENHIFVILLIK